mmetsp:Transcript_26821/g.59360  ORF Transcript_26821/g.59360 Transcript_26821/m.59360 type:complete len:157 (+) Transcript_26821:1282-1752(+)
MQQVLSGDEECRTVGLSCISAPLQLLQVQLVVGVGGQLSASSSTISIGTNTISVLCMLCMLCMLSMLSRGTMSLIVDEAVERAPRTSPNPKSNPRARDRARVLKFSICRHLQQRYFPQPLIEAGLATHEAQKQQHRMSACPHTHRPRETEAPRSCG